MKHRFHRSQCHTKQLSVDQYGNVGRSPPLIRNPHVDFYLNDSISLAKIRRATKNVTTPLVRSAVDKKSASFYNGEHCNSIIFIHDKKY